MELTTAEAAAVVVLILCVAALYASVGHGGASGYLAVLSFVTIDPLFMSTTALMLNILVAGISMVQFSRARHFSWERAWPFVVLSIPCSFVGGVIKVSSTIYFLLLAAVLLFAAGRLIREPRVPAEEQPVSPSRVLALGAGGGIGFLSGVVGVGGGIFLSPLMLLMGWATTKQTAAISAFFIVVNSLAGLGGRLAGKSGLEVGTLWPFVLAAAVGGIIGASLGASRLPPKILRQLLGIVLLIASGKLLFFALSG